MRTKKYNVSLKDVTTSQSGFTLVELLIVVVIIGILAGVVIGVLNPQQQQRRAKDGANRAQLDKLALSTKSLFVSSPRTQNRSPLPTEFIGGVGSGTNIQANCNANVAPNAIGQCTFEISGLQLEADCANNYTGIGGGNRCMYHYWRNGTSFRLESRGSALPVQTFVYEYNEAANGTVTEGFYVCGNAFDISTTSPIGNAGCTLMN